MKGWWPVLILMALSACSLRVNPNLQWAKEKGVQFEVKEVGEVEWAWRMSTDERWKKMLEEGGLAPWNVLCVTDTESRPPVIYIRSGVYVKGRFGPILIKSSNSECLEEEVGHIREAYEGVPFHTKYSRERMLGFPSR